jgi:hypothetical protein
MTQEDKELLLKDLCARLPYGVKVKLGDNPNIFDLEYRIKFAIMYGDSDKLEDILDITNIKPYLFPLSSMSEEQIKEFNSITQKCNTYIGKSTLLTDFCNKHHIDWRGLIEKGLAIDATGLNIY